MGMPAEQPDTWQDNKMTTRHMIVWICGIAAVTFIMSAIVYGSVERTKIKAEQHTLRADGRHQLLDLFGRLK